MSRRGRGLLERLISRRHTRHCMRIACEHQRTPGCTPVALSGEGSAPKLCSCRVALTPHH
eukprot:6190366-Pleurochrysis_carterae.AAC.2